MYLVDCHCHLDLYPSFEDAISQAENENVYSITMTTTPKAWERNIELTQKTKFVRAALGFHPQLVTARNADLCFFYKHVNDARYIGEIGIDASPQCYKDFDKQCVIFSDLLKECSTLGGKILSIHSRRSTKKCLDIIESSYVANSCKIILHWFSGSKYDLSRALQLGCYFSVNKAMLASPNLVKHIQQDRLLTETDFPFTSKLGFPSQKQEISNIIDMLSMVYKDTPDGITDIIWTNFKGLLA